MEVEVSLSPEFVNTIPDLSSVAVKSYIILKAVENLTQPSDGFVQISYETLSIQTGIKSTKTLREAIVELTLSGWVEDYKKGGYKTTEAGRVNYSNQYKLSDKKLNQESIKKVYKKMKSERKRVD